MHNEGLPAVERCPVAPAGGVDVPRGASLAARSPLSNEATDALFLALPQGFRRRGGLPGGAAWVPAFRFDAAATVRPAAVAVHPAARVDPPVAARH
ncbi:hypothetical protein ACPOLB_24505 [Rubrivivax sp. RP6-9]|uniref:hypothetical protein n=1 Tax=Rubrivivax sp. RP6-9 TaxID=3415750 RepID=UPI003CC6966B